MHIISIDLPGHLHFANTNLNTSPEVFPTMATLNWFVVENYKIEPKFYKVDARVLFQTHRNKLHFYPNWLKLKTNQLLGKQVPRRIVTLLRSSPPNRKSKLEMNRIRRNFE
jgi:hypothetical protein